jgi:hypothetical protein
MKPIWAFAAKATIARITSGARMRIGGWHQLQPRALQTQENG